MPRRQEEEEEKKEEEEEALDMSAQQARSHGDRCPWTRNGTLGFRSKSRDNQKSLSGEPWEPRAREPATASLATAEPLRQKRRSGVLPRKLLPEVMTRQRQQRAESVMLQRGQQQQQLDHETIIWEEVVLTKD